MTIPVIVLDLDAFQDVFLPMYNAYRFLVQDHVLAFLG